MSVARFGLPALMILFLATSGCVQGAATGTVSPSTSAPPPAAEPAPSIDTGSISGTVVNEEAVPLVGATVAIIDLQKEAKTDEVGAFTFNEVPPGKRKLLFQMIGYTQVGRSVDVVAGQVAELKGVTLRALAIETEWVQVEKWQQGVLSGNYISAFPNDVQTWNKNWALKDDPKVLMDLLFEVDWTPSTAFGDGIRFWSWIEKADSDRTLCVGEGNDPYVCKTEPAKLAQDWNCDFAADDDCRAALRFRPGGSRAASGAVGLWPQETIEGVTSHFYRAPMPADYSAIPK